MSDLSSKFTTLEGQLATQAATLGSYIDTTEGKLQLILDFLDVMNINNAANTKYLLAAIGQSCYCEPGSTPPLITPPTSPTTHPINADKCKRVQAFLHAMQEVFTVLDIVSAVGVGFTPNLILDAYNQVIASLGNTDDTGVPSFPEAVQLAGSLLNYVGGNIFVGGTLSGYFSPLIFDLRDAMFLSSSPSSAQSAYNGVISGSSVPGYAQDVLTAAAYNALYSYYFDPTSTPNLTGYDGDACGIAGCVTVTAVATSINGGATFWAIEWPTAFFGVNTNSPGVTSNKLTWATRDLDGWTVNPSVTAKQFVDAADSGDSLTPGTAHLIGEPTPFYALVRNDGGSGSFTAEMCPP